MTEGQPDTRAGGAGTANQLRPPSVVSRTRSDRQPRAAQGGTASSQPVDAETKLAETGPSAGNTAGAAGPVHAARLPSAHTTKTTTRLRIGRHWRPGRDGPLPTPHETARPEHRLRPRPHIRLSASSAGEPPLEWYEDRA